MSANGLWNVVVDTPMGKQTGTLDLTVDGSRLTGVNTAMGASDPIENGTVDGDHLTFQVRASKPMPMLLTFDLQLQDGETLGDSTGGGARQ